MGNEMRNLEPKLDELRKQHQLLLAETRRLKEELERTRRNSAAATRVRPSFSKLEFLLRTHQTQEEAILLPIVNKHLDPQVGGNILAEHHKISQALKEIQHLVSGLNKTNRQAHAAKLRTALAEFETSTRQHFSREENVLFWYASLAQCTPGTNAL